jgi:ankyrin repeat protein
MNEFPYEIDVNARLNFRGDTLLHYACARNNVALVRYLVSRKDILLTTKNFMNQAAKDLSLN